MVGKWGGGVWLEGWGGGYGWKVGVRARYGWKVGVGGGVALGQENRKAA